MAQPRSTSTISLKEAIQLARAKNLTLQAVRYNANLAEADVSTAKLRPNPVLNNQTLQLIDGAYHPAGTAYFSPINRQVWWQLTTRVQVAGQRRNAIALARQNAKAMQADVLGSERELLNATAQQWLNIWEAKQNQRVIQRAKANADSLVYISEIRLRNQAITLNDLKRTLIIKEQYAARLRAAEEQVHIEEILLSELLNFPPDSVTADTLAASMLILFPQQVDSLVSLALTFRPEIQSIQFAKDAAASSIKLQESNRYPVPELGLIWNPQNTVPYLGIFATLPLPIFDRNQGGRLKARAVSSQIQKRNDALRVSIKTEIFSAFNKYSIAKENLSRYTSIAADAEKILKITRYSYLKGGTTLIDYLEAERTWFDTLELFYRSQVQLHRSQIEILTATGYILNIVD